MSVPQKQAGVSTLLLTLALNPPSGVPYLKMGDESLRRASSKASLFFWASIGGIKRMVLADATGSTLLNEQDLELLQQLGIEVEQLCFEQDPEAIRNKGKGFAEGRLIDFAVATSRILAEEGGFWKCTGKVFVRNFSEINQIVASNRLKNLFWKQIWAGIDRPMVADTRFWLATTDFYRKYLSSAYAAADDARDIAVESVCVGVLNQVCKPAKIQRPTITGMSGGFATLYPEHDLGDFNKIFPCWIG